MAFVMPLSESAAPMDPPHPTCSSPERQQRTHALLACGVTVGTVLTLVALGHDGRRVAQLVALAIPALAWLAWPVRSAAMHRLRTAVVWLWAMAFALDGVARAYPVSYTHLTLPTIYSV